MYFLFVFLHRWKDHLFCLSSSTENLLLIFQREDLKSDESSQFWDLLYGETMADKAGFLTKEGGRWKSWKKRWFVLKNDLIYYSKKQVKKKSERKVF